MTGAVFFKYIEILASPQCRCRSVNIFAVLSGKISVFASTATLGLMRDSQFGVGYFCFSFVYKFNNAFALERHREIRIHRAVCFYSAHQRFRFVCAEHAEPEKRGYGSVYAGSLFSVVINFQL